MSWTNRWTAIRLAQEFHQLAIEVRHAGCHEVDDCHADALLEQGDALGNEGAAVWKEKVRNYLRYASSGKFQERFQQPRFRVLVVANSEPRMQAIRSVVKGLTEKIFWFSTLQAIQRDGLWASIWLRPAEDSLRSLF